MMLRHMQLPSFADRIEDAITETLAVRTVVLSDKPDSCWSSLVCPTVHAQDKRNWTKDVGGSLSTSKFVDAIVSKL